MSRRRTARQIRAAGRIARVGGGEAPACWCGARRWAYDLRMFPMRHVSRCLDCGAQVTVTLKPPGSPKKPKPPDPEPWGYGFGWWP